jgi:hypothetical protein
MERDHNLPFGVFAAQLKKGALHARGCGRKTERND